MVGEAAQKSTRGRGMEKKQGLNKRQSLAFTDIVEPSENVALQSSALSA
jgi:hypothetical protein